MSESLYHLVYSSPGGWGKSNTERTHLYHESDGCIPVFRTYDDGLRYLALHFRTDEKTSQGIRRADLGINVKLDRHAPHVREKTTKLTSKNRIVESNDGVGGRDGKA